jgi:prephenate dehydratase
MSARASERVGYLGPAGTFSEEALLASAVRERIEAVPFGSIYDAIVALRDGEVAWTIAPIENSLDGSISVTLDLLAEEHGGPEIVGEAVLRVRHSLIGCGQIELSQIDTVLTHPQVPGQCLLFLRDELPQARVLPAASTAEAVRTVMSEGLPTQAAIGTLLAASIYEGTVLRDGVEDRDDNETRFVWLARAGESGLPPLAAPPAAEWKTSIVFWGLGAESPGWLVRCLDEFARREINLTKIESRPRRERLGRYMFFVDLVGRVADPLVAEAIAGVSALSERVLVLGSYPVAEIASSRSGGEG